MNDYYQNSADAYDFSASGGVSSGGEDQHQGHHGEHHHQQDQSSSAMQSFRGKTFSQEVDFDDPKINTLPKILLMGPRRGGKTSIQVSKNK